MLPSAGIALSAVLECRGDGWSTSRPADLSRGAVLPSSGITTLATVGIDQWVVNTQRNLISYRYSNSDWLCNVKSDQFTSNAH